MLTMNPWERTQSRGRERLGTYLDMTSTGPGFRHFVLPRAMNESISDSTERDWARGGSRICKMRGHGTFEQKMFMKLTIGLETHHVGKEAVWAA